MNGTLIQLQSWVNRLYACIMKVALPISLCSAAVNCHAARLLLLFLRFLFEQMTSFVFLNFRLKRGKVESVHWLSEIL